MEIDAGMIGRRKYEAQLDVQSEIDSAAFSTMLCGQFPASRALFGQAHHITAIIDDCKSNITKTEQHKPTIDGCGISNFCHLSSQSGVV